MGAARSKKLYHFCIVEHRTDRKNTTPDCAARKLKDVAAGEGHCIMLSGEAGIGKTALVRACCQDHLHHAKVYIGICDALFTPRPLAPLYDIIWQIWKTTGSGKERTAQPCSPTSSIGSTSNPAHPFSYSKTSIGPTKPRSTSSNSSPAASPGFDACLSSPGATRRSTPCIAERAARTICRPIRPPRSSSHHSRKMPSGTSQRRGYRGEDVYDISGGNPFYVNEILARLQPRYPRIISKTASCRSTARSNGIPARSVSSSPYARRV